MQKSECFAGNTDTDTGTDTDTNSEPGTRNPELCYGKPL
jgi:hypothetical protein